MTRVLSKTLKNCVSFVVAQRSVMPRTSGFSCITLETKVEPLSVIINLGRQACLVLISMMTFAVLTALGLDIG